MHVEKFLNGGSYTVFIFILTKKIFAEEVLSTALDLINMLEIRHCIFVAEEKKNLDLSRTKIFSLKNIPSLYMRYDELAHYIDEVGPIYFRTAVIMHENDLVPVEKFIANLEDVSRKNL